jgi:nitrate/nitrite transporter NarK
MLSGAFSKHAFERFLGGIMFDGRLSRRRNSLVVALAALLVLASISISPRSGAGEVVALSVAESIDD